MRFCFQLIKKKNLRLYAKSSNGETRSRHFSYSARPPVVRQGCASLCCYLSSPQARDFQILFLGCYILAFQAMFPAHPKSFPAQFVNAVSCCSFFSTPSHSLQQGGGITHFGNHCSKQIHQTNTSSPRFLMGFVLRTPLESEMDVIRTSQE